MTSVTQRSDCTQPVATPNDIILLSGLVPFTPYYISVQACNDGKPLPTEGKPLSLRENPPFSPTHLHKGVLASLV